MGKPVGAFAFSPVSNAMERQRPLCHDDNVIYYFDTAVNLYLIDEGGLDPRVDDVIGICSKTHCNLYSAVTYPERLETGLRVARPRNSSVCYEIGIR